MKNIKLLLVAALVIMMTSCNYLIKDYAYDTNPDALKTRSMLDYWLNSPDKSCTLYAQAIKRAGLEDVIDRGNVTCIVPNNMAIEAFLGRIKVSSIDQVNPQVLRAIFSYMIVPGNYRSISMEDNKSYKLTSFTEDPVWLMRKSSSDDKFRLLVNSDSSLATGAVEVVKQDFLFKNGVVAQVVSQMVNYEPSVKQPDAKPDNVDDSASAKDTLVVTDDLSIYNGGKNNNYDANAAGILISGRPGASEDQFRLGLFKFELKEVAFIEDIVSAKLTVRVANTAAYAVDNEVKLDIYEIYNDTWVESKPTSWSTFSSSNWLKWPATIKGPVVNTIKFDVIGNKQSAYEAQEVLATGDISTSIINYYSTKFGQGNNFVTYGLIDASDRMISAGSTTIYICSKETPASIKFDSYITLSGPFPSKLRMISNQSVSAGADGVVALTPQNSFKFAGPEQSDGFSYASNNVIFVVREQPSKGILMKYGLPMARNEKFTMKEMESGVVKYVNIEPGADSFKIKATDYLGGVYYPDPNDDKINYITVNVQ